jgi:hypothetical protein
VEPVKRFVKKILLLGVLLIFIIIALNRLGIKAGSIYKDGAALVCETKREMIRSGAIHYRENKVNVLFMGSSRILAGIVPIYFDELTGGKTFSYNLALPALPIFSSYFVLKDYLEKNSSPYYIIMMLYINRCRSCTLVNYYASQGMIGLDEVASLAINMRNKSIILNYVFPFKMYKFHAVQYLYNSILHPSNIRQLQGSNRSILNRMKENRGYYFIEEQAVSSDNRLPPGFVKKRQGPTGKDLINDPFIDPYVKKFFDLTEKNQVEVFLIQPAYRENQHVQYEGMPPHYVTLLKHYSHVSIAKEGWKLKFYENRFFSDPTHLNREGALRYTREIYNEFSEIFP